MTENLTILVYCKKKRIPAIAKTKAAFIEYDILIDMMEYKRDERQQMEADNKSRNFI